MLLNGLLVLWHQIFEADRRNVNRKTECFVKRFYTSAKKEGGTLSVYKSSSLAAAQQTVFPYPAFSDANKALEYLQQASEKRATLTAY